MNIERINELMRQAILWCDENFPELEGYYGEELEYKFAELIVRECAGFLRDDLDDHFAAEQLEEHFGVE
jgi:hypothetical protein